jgi:hypothetical protein
MEVIVLQGIRSYMISMEWMGFFFSFFFKFALGMLEKEGGYRVTWEKVIYGFNVADGIFFPKLALGMLEKEGGYMVTREKVLHDLNVTNGVLIKTCNC